MIGLATGPTDGTGNNESELHTTDSAASNARYEHDTEAAETARDRLQRMTSIISNWGTW